eukprot:jgi/Chrzof1/5803/Cz16g16130.t1
MSGHGSAKDAAKNTEAKAKQTWQKIAGKKGTPEREDFLRKLILGVGVALVTVGGGLTTWAAVQIDKVKKDKNNRNKTGKTL